jgi:hypothetical protein
MIYLSHIVPTDYLDKLDNSGTRVYLALAHQILENTQYRNFYAHQRAEGHYVILDNSAFELGSAIDDNLLVRAAEYIQPNEVVLPDSLFNADETLRRVTAFMERRVLTDINFMAVPHGATIDEYITCYSKLCNLPGVTTIGVGAVYSNHFRDNHQSGRTKILQELQTRQILSDKPHHLLGLGDDGNLELKTLKDIKNIRSCDSSAAYVQALNDVKLSPNQGYSKFSAKINFNDHITDSTLDILRHNTRILEEAVR